MTKKKETQSTPEGATTETEPKEVGTTEKLFSDLIDVDAAPGEATPPPAVVEGADAETVKPEGTAPEKETKEEQIPATSEKSKEPVYLSLKEHGDQRVKLNVEGKEEEVSFEDLIRRNQTDRFLTLKGQAVAQERQKLEEERRVLAVAPPPAPVVTDPETEEFARTHVDPKLKPVLNRVDALEEKLLSVTPALGEMKYQSDLKIIDKEMRSAGLDDFMAHVPKIEQAILELPVEQQAGANTFEFYKSMFQTIKLKELQGQANKPREIRKGPDDRSPPPVVSIEGGSSVPTGMVGSKEADLMSSLFDIATKSQKRDDWVKYFVVRDKVEKGAVA